MARDDDRYDDDREYDAEDIATASRKVKPPAIALMIAGVLSLLSVGWGVYQFMNFDKEFDAEIAKSQRQQGGTPEQQRAAKEFAGVVKDVMKVVMPVGLGFQTFTAVLMIIGAARALPLASRGWGMAAATAAFVPHFTCLIWFLSLAFGIWMLVTLGNKEVKRGFAAKAGDGGGRRDRDDDRRDRDDDRRDHDYESGE